MAEDADKTPPPEPARPWTILIGGLKGFTHPPMPPTPPRNQPKPTPADMEREPEAQPHQEGTSA